jgi:hypothetical protein
MFLTISYLLSKYKNILIIMTTPLSYNRMGFYNSSWKINLEDTKRNFPTIESKLNFNHKIDANGKLVLATLLKGKAP